MEHQIIKFVQEEYSALGISVKSYGKDSILLSLPNDCTDISSVVVELINTFNLSIDFEVSASGPTLLCWYGEKQINQNTNQHFFWKFAVVFLCLVAIALRWL